MRKHLKSLAVLLLLTLLLSSLAACTSTAHPAATAKESSAEASTTLAATPTEAEPSTAPSSQQAEAGLYPLTVEDSSQRQVQIPQEPKRIVSLGPNMSELLFALGEGKRLVGRTTYCDYPAEVLDVQAIGTLMEPDLEKIAELAPDLVLASTHVSEETIAALTKIKIPVLMLYDNEHLAGLYDIITLLGKVLQVEPKAAELNNELQQRLAAVQEKVAAAPKPKLYYVVGFGEGGDYTAGGNTFINDIIKAAGGENIAQDVSDWSFSLEKLLELDPEVIIIPAWAEAFKETEQYKELSAVKNNKVFVIDNNTIDRQGPRNAEGVEALAKLLHPELFK